MPRTLPVGCRCGRPMYARGALEIFVCPRCDLQPLPETTTKRPSRASRPEGAPE